MEASGKKQDKKKLNARAAKDKTRDIPEEIKAAHEEAESDIAQDPDLSIHSPNDDLDEGESARLGEDLSGII